MKIIAEYICPPIPMRGNDWLAYFDGMEDGPTGSGATKKEAINDLFDNSDVEDLASWFGIEAREVDTQRGPEYGHWVAYTDAGVSVEAGWRDVAIVDLAFKLAEVTQ